MSRTVRRKNMPRSDERGWTHEDDMEHANLHGGWKKYSWYDGRTREKHEKWCFSQVAFSGRKSIPLPKKEYDKAWWQLHGDHHKGYWGRKKLHLSDWGSVRNKNHKNLNQWLLDPEKEVFFWEDVNTKDWD